VVVLERPRNVSRRRTAIACFGQQGQHLLLPFAKRPVNPPGPLRKCARALSFGYAWPPIGCVPPQDRSRRF
jgi:hypothetical protein